MYKKYLSIQSQNFQNHKMKNMKEILYGLKNAMKEV